ncbi:MAG: DUF2160 family membrane protein [Nitrososphaerota archaeon]
MTTGVLESFELWLNEMMPWMYWKGEVALFFIFFFSFLTILAIYNIKKPSNPRSGILRIPTTLGDRIFVSVVIFIAVMLTVAALGLPLYLLIIALPILIIILLRG